MNRWIAILSWTLLLLGCQMQPRSADKDPWWTPVLDRCEKGDLEACEQLQEEGLRSWLGTKLHEVGQHAASVACDRDDPSSCSRLAVLASAPRAKRTALERACRLGVAPDCIRLWRANTFGEKQLGLKPNPAAGLPWAERACLIDPKVNAPYCQKHEVSYDDP